MGSSLYKKDTFGKHSHFKSTSLSLTFNALPNTPKHYYYFYFYLLFLNTFNYSSLFLSCNSPVEKNKKSWSVLKKLL
ncbi:hypothetical protein L6452_44040 [Arctium lappa]|uniref:Uncharacterized protein n=1 Tax=Arctium lappa TaxID=4217 RepID=A0ACB8XEI9_ARCLA|nr:hypothetical protein L6452_44040 [Arctium lappa]